MTRLAVVADDLTGALDAAAPFAARGLRTVVALSVSGIDDALKTGADIIGVSTDSREVAPAAARDAVALCVAKLDGIRIFKKVDSRLKGNVAAELDAIPFARGLAIPAIPAFGRWSHDGMLGGFGVSEPVSIAERLGRHASRVVVPDATNETDIVQALVGTAHDLPIGARGLAEALAIQLAPDAGASRVPTAEAPAICIIGSTDPITLAQIDVLRQACPTLDYRGAPDGVLADARPARNRLTIVQALPGRTGADPSSVALGLARALLDLEPPHGATLVISGGATAQIVLQALELSTIEILGEAMPGLPIARAGGFTLITKSGGFGQPHTLRDLLGHLVGIAQSQG